MPLILGSTAVVLLAIVAAVMALKPSASPEPADTPVTTAAPPPASDKPSALTQQNPVKTPQVQVPATKGTEIAVAPAKPGPAPRQQEPEEEEEEPTPAPPPVSAPPPNRVGATAVSAGRVGQAPPRQTWTGSPTGQIQWTGQLPPGSRIVLSRGRVIEGPGVLTGAESMPPFSDVDITSISPYGNLIVAASGANLIVGNTGQAPIGRIEITWRVKP